MSNMCVVYIDVSSLFKHTHKKKKAKKERRSERVCFGLLVQSTDPCNHWS